METSASPRFEDPPVEITREERSPSSSYVHRIWQHWFVEHNPLYLASAALVLGGLTLVSRELAHESLGALGVAAIAELYAFALIGGAALLTRLGLRRPAVMLGLLVVLFQGDLTMHVETCAFLGAVGLVAAALWVVLFVIKLYLLALALELTPSRSALVVPAVGALALASLPTVLRELDAGAGSALVALVVFGVGAAGAWTERRVDSAVGYELRGLRSLRAAWSLGAALGLAHVAYWAGHGELTLVAVLPALPLVGTRLLRDERAVWTASAMVLGLVGLAAPALLSVTALMVALTFVLHALRRPLAVEPASRALGEPYRGALTRVEPPVTTYARAEAWPRLLVGAASSVHLALWTAGWHGGPWPAHSIVLDVALVVPCLVLVARARSGLGLVPITLTAGHLAAVTYGLPRTRLEWGVSSVSLGFVLLGVGLLVTWRLRRRELEPLGPAPADTE